MALAHERGGTLHVVVLMPGDYFCDIIATFLDGYVYVINGATLAYRDGNHHYRGQG